MEKKSRRWIFVENNKDSVKYAADVMRYMVYQVECGNEKKTKHVQGYVVWSAPRNMTWIKKHFSNTAHLEIARGTDEQNVAYCTKSETRIDGPYEFGERVKPGKRSDIHELRDEINKGKHWEQLVDDDRFVTLCAKYPKFIDRLHARNLSVKSATFREVLVTVLHGPAGTGKTSYVYSKHEANSVYKLDGWKKDSLWFDGYNGQDVLLIDDFYGWIKYSLLLKLLDGYQTRLEVKGGFTYAMWTKVYITSNKSPCEWYKNKGLTEALERRLHRVLLVEKNMVMAQRFVGNTRPQTQEKSPVELIDDEIECQLKLINVVSEG